MKKRAYKGVLCFLLGLTLSMSVYSASDVELRSGHPNVYVVQKGDTLWDISSQFLVKPWLWPEIWQVNPQVANPHLIYPGDVLSLVYIGGKPKIVRKRGILKLSPKTRVISQGDAIPALPLEQIKPFLVGARVVTAEQIDKAPYMLASDGDHLVAGKDVRIYARGLVDPEVTATYAMFRKGDEYKDPVTQESLGFEAVHLGTAKVVRTGDPTTLDITESVKESYKGDRLLPVDQQHLQPYFFPHVSKKVTDGQIISVYEGVTQIGQFNVVIINRGEREGVEVGNVFKVMRRGKMVEDNFAEDTGFQGKTAVMLPDEEAGEIMVFRTFEKVSLALVMTATRPMHIMDRLESPY